MKIVIPFLLLLVSVYGSRIRYINRGVIRSIYPDQRYAPYVARYLRSRYGLDVYAGRIPSQYFSRSTSSLGVIDGGTDRPFTGDSGGSGPFTPGMTGFSVRSGPLGGDSDMTSPSGPSSSPGFSSDSPVFPKDDFDSDGPLTSRGPNGGISLSSIRRMNPRFSDMTSPLGPSSSPGVSSDSPVFPKDDFDSDGPLTSRGPNGGISLSSIRSMNPGFLSSGMDINDFRDVSSGGIDRFYFGDGGRNPGGIAVGMRDFRNAGVGPSDFSDGSFSQSISSDSGGLDLNGFDIRGMSSGGTSGGMDLRDLSGRGLITGSKAFSSMYDSDGYAGTYYGPRMSFTRGYSSYPYGYPFGSFFRGGSFRSRYYPSNIFRSMGFSSRGSRAYM